MTAVRGLARAASAPGRPLRGACRSSCVGRFGGGRFPLAGRLRRPLQVAGRPFSVRCRRQALFFCTK